MLLVGSKLTWMVFTYSIFNIKINVYLVQIHDVIFTKFNTKLEIHDPINSRFSDIWTHKFSNYA